MEAEEPIRILPKQDTSEPILPNLRRESEEPKFTKLKTLIAEPKRDTDLKLNEDPTCIA
jgi:hypothetical protein